MTERDHCSLLTVAICRRCLPQPPPTPNRRLKQTRRPHPLPHRRKREPRTSMPPIIEQRLCHGTCKLGREERNAATGHTGRRQVERNGSTLRVSRSRCSEGCNSHIIRTPEGRSDPHRHARLFKGYKATAKINKDDIEAAADFYETREGAPLWVNAQGFTPRAKAAMDEIKKADDWGLEASAFTLPEAAGTTPEALAEAEGKLTLELLKYVRFARGGRVLPSSLSRILDQEPPLKEPKIVMGELDKAADVDAYLRDQHPKHEQFKLLKAALLKERGPAEPEPAIDEALKVKIPETKKPLKLGADDPAVALLRKRLKVATAEGGKETVFDEKLADAVKAYQSEKGLKASGQVSNATRQALNKEGEPKVKNRDNDVQRIILNMERWRWMPENLGDRYVWNNIPEFYTRVIKNGEEIFKEKIIVGMPSWATPVFSANMQYVSFNPSWGMPDGIKSRELAPRLKQAGGGFFLFGGGGGGSVVKATASTSTRTANR